MSRPTLSVIVPNFNGSAYLKDALTAIINQSLPPDEIIIVDDASTDDSLKIIERLRHNCASLRLLRNERNQGVVASVNLGIQAAQGEFFHGAAVDDLVVSDFYAQSMRLLEQFPQAGLCSGLSWVTDDKGNEIRSERVRLRSRQETCLSAPRALLWLRSRGSWFWGNTTIYRRSAYNVLGGFKLEFGSYCDSVLSQAIALKFGACYIPRFLGSWRRHPAGFSSQTIAQPELVLSLIRLIGDWMRSRPDHLFPEDYVQLWQRRELLELARRRIVAQPEDRLSAIDMIDSNLHPRTRPDQWAIDIMRRYSYLCRPLLKILKKHQMIPRGS